MASDTPPLLVSVKSAAETLGVSPWAVYQLLDAQKLPSRYVGRRRLVPYEALTEYVANLPTHRDDSEGISA